MAYLLDTNILLRIAQPQHAMHRGATKVVRALFRRRKTLHIVPQTVYEFWVVATRPVANNGLGLSIEKTRRLVQRAESFFTLLLDTQLIYREWLRLVGTHNVTGVNAHDARLVAAMKVHGMSHLLMFNADDCKRYHGTEITPAEITRSLPVAT